MAAPRSTLWTLEPHTAAKHAILRRYLQAWAAIVGQRFPRVLYVDGFAGPGAYAGGEEGSPLIALNAALANATLISGRVDFLFVERDAVRAAHLADLVRGLGLPQNFVVTIEPGKSFEEAFPVFRVSRFGASGGLPPTFAFLDPFGWKGLPMSLVRDILGQPRSEVLINFMYEEINRFLSHPDHPESFDALFGTRAWRDALALTKPIERNRALHDLYARQLADGGRYVRSFCMRNAGGATDYFLFYATRSLLGLKKMKEAMWKVDRSGAFTFSDATDPKQLVLLGDSPRLDVLQDAILRRFGGTDATYETVETFVLVETAFRETHCKAVLRELEMSKPPALSAVGAPPGRRAGTYADLKLVLRFAARHERLSL